MDQQKLLALLGLANRAGKLAVGFSAVEQMVRGRRRALVIVATGVGASQLGKIRHWEDRADIVADAVGQEALAAALGREKLVVVAVTDPGFVKGIEKLKS